MRIRICFAAFLLLAAIGVAAAAEDAPVPVPEVSIREASVAWFSRTSFPVFIDARALPDRELRLAVSIDSSRNDTTVVRYASLAPGASTRLEMTAPSADFYVTCSGGGENWTRSFNGHFEEAYFDGRFPAPLACVNSYLLRDLETLDSAEKKENLIHRALPLDELPGRWQSYVGLVSILVIEPREAALFRPDQREAIARWVRWFGGRVWLAGDGASEAAKTLGFDLSPTRSEPWGESVKRHYVGNGSVFIQTRADAAALAMNVPAEAAVNPLTPYFFRGRYSRNTPGEWLRDTLMGVSANVITICLLVLGVILGPINYWFIRRRDNSLLFFITTPAIAILGTLGIFLVSFLSEGTGGRYNQFAILVRNAVDGDAMLFDLRGVRPGFYASTPRFSADTAAFPVRGYGDYRRFSVDATGGFGMTDGWLVPRFPTGFILAQPVVSRMNVEVEEEGGRHYAVNNLGFTVASVAAMLPDGTVARADNLAPGERKPLRKADDTTLYEMYRDRVTKFTEYEPAFSGVTLVARCEGLPYLEDGGMNARLVDGEYYYVVAGDAGGLRQ